MKRLLLALVAVLVFSAPVLAQGEEVALRFYIVPVVQVGIYRSPAHFGGRSNPVDAQLVGVTWGMMDYGLINVGIVGAQVNATQATYLAGLSDIQPVPANIDTVLTTQGQVNTVSNALEAFNIPGTWVNVGDSYRTVMREIAGYFQFMQRLTTITGINPTTLSINLSTRYNQLNATWQNALLQTFSELGYSTAKLSGTSTLRAILRDIASQNDTRTFQLGGISF